MSLRSAPTISKGLFLPLRNLIFFFAIYLFLQEITLFSSDILQFIKGAIVFVIGYQSIYFINDYFDSDYDKKLHRPYNLYLFLTNKRWFWFLSAFFLIVGMVVSVSISYTSFMLYLLLIIINLLYSAPPFRTKDILFIRGLTLGILYSLKVIFVAAVFNFPFRLIPSFFLIFLIFLVGFVNSVRKSYEGKIQTIEALIFGTPLVLITLLGLLVFPLRVWFIILVVGVISGGLYKLSLLFYQWKN